jgi:hypothetical protein
MTSLIGEASQRTSPSHRESRCERGTALVVALLAMLVMGAIGAALMLSAATESRITRNFSNNTEALYAADAVLERVVDELRGIGDWNLVLAGTVRSIFVDGEPRGTRVLSDGSTIDLGAVLNDANCRRIDGCSAAAMDAITAERPWGVNNPRWQLFAWGYLRGLVPGGRIASPFYVVVMVADDASECDDNPLIDGGAPVSCPGGAKANPGAGVLGVRAQAFGPWGAHRVLELIMARAAPGAAPAELMPTEGTAENKGNTAGYGTGAGQAGVRLLSWREVR